MFEPYPNLDEHVKLLPQHVMDELVLQPI